MEAQARHILVASEQACTDLKQQAAFEAKQMLNQAQVIRIAAQEELEAHRIYVEAARLNAESHEVLVHARTKFEEPPQGQSEESPPNLKPAERRQKGAEAEDYNAVANELGAMRKITSKATKPTGKTKAASNGRKPARKAKSAS